MTTPSLADPVAPRVALGEMTWPEVAALTKRDPVVVIPTGSCEQHGWHLPLQTDALLAGAIAMAAARQVAPDVPVAVTPPLPVGMSDEHLPFPGTLSLSPSTYLALVEDLANSLVQHGFRRILFLNGHGGNADALRLTVQHLRQQHRALFATSNYWSLAREELAEAAGDRGLRIAHGGEVETALTLHLMPELARMALARPASIGPKNPYTADNLLSEGRATVGRRRTDLSQTGHAGDPTQGTAEQGERYFSIIVSSVAGFFRWLAAAPLPESLGPAAPP